MMGRRAKRHILLVALGGLLGVGVRGPLAGGNELGPAAIHGDAGTAPTQVLSGVWTVSGSLCSQSTPSQAEQVRVSQTGTAVTATQVTGNPCVAKGAVEWTANLTWDLALHPMLGVELHAPGPAAVHGNLIFTNSTYGATLYVPGRQVEYKRGLALSLEYVRTLPAPSTVEVPTDVVRQHYGIRHDGVGDLQLSAAIALRKPKIGAAVQRAMPGTNGGGGANYPTRGVTSGGHEILLFGGDFGLVAYDTTRDEAEIYEADGQALDDYHTSTSGIMVVNDLVLPGGGRVFGNADPQLTSILLRYASDSLRTTRAPLAGDPVVAAAAGDVSAVPSLEEVLPMDLAAPPPMRQPESLDDAVQAQDEAEGRALVQGLSNLGQARRPGDQVPNHHLYARPTQWAGPATAVSGDGMIRVDVPAGFRAAARDAYESVSHGKARNATRRCASAHSSCLGSGRCSSRARNRRGFSSGLR